MTRTPNSKNKDTHEIATETPPDQQTVTKPAPSPAPARGPAIPVLIALFTFVVVTFGAGTMLGRPALKWASDTFASAFGNGSEGGDDGWYACGMHPWIVFQDSEALCTICRMELTPIDPSKFSNEVTIDPVVVQNIGIRIEPVTLGPVERTIRTVGTISFDETRVRDVNIKAEGWIEKLYVDFEGAAVQVGDPLFDQYSPTLYTAQSEYLSALRMHSASQAISSNESLIDTQRLVDDARVQLEYFDVTPEQIALLEANGEPSKTLTMRSPHTGIVIAKHANEGMLVNQGMRVYQIADLTTVWVMVSLFEYQLPFLEEGLPVTMTLPYIPGQVFEGEVAYIYPFLDGDTRQVRVRLEFDNAEQLLKPGMFANVALTKTLAEDRILAPRSAVIDTGERAVAFVSLGEGRFEPRDVILGVETGTGDVEILEGLDVDEMVVTSGQFLLDSESRVRESLMKMIKGDLAADQPAVVTADSASAITELPEKAAIHLSDALTHYFAISELLATDTTENMTAAATSLAASIDALMEIDIPGYNSFRDLNTLAQVGLDARRLYDVSDIESARRLMADLSSSVDTVLRTTGIPLTFKEEVHEFHCPMYLDEQGGSLWLQPAGKARNPYMGAAMLECFDERSLIPFTGGATPDDSDEDTTNPPPAESNQDDAAVDDPDPTPIPPDQAAAKLISIDDQDAVDQLFKFYIAMQEELSRDELENLSSHLDAFTLTLASLEASESDSVSSITSELRKGVAIDSTDLDSFRTGYRTLSDAMIEFARAVPPSSSIAPAIYHAYCPMEKANWLQLGEEVTNPYAPYMLRCGSIEETFTATDGGSP